MGIFRFLKTIAPAAVAATLPCMLGSCVAPILYGMALSKGAEKMQQNAANSDPKKTKLAKDQKTTVDQGISAGGLAGAGAGFAMGMKSGHPFMGAAIGGLFGDSLGYMVGMQVAAMKAQMFTNEQNLNACITEAQEENKKVRGLVTSLDLQLSALKIRARKAKQSKDPKQLKQVKDELTTVDHRTSGLIKSIDSTVRLRQGVSKKASSISKARSQSINSSVSSLNESRQQLQSIHQQLSSTMSSL